MDTFLSKIDSSYYAILGLYGILSMSFCLFSKSLGSFLFVGLLFLFIITQLHAIKYKIDSSSKKLIISGGIFYSSSLDIKSIISIEKDRSMSAVPVASFDRLSIKIASRVIKISPNNQDVFLEVIKKINSDISINY